MKSIEEFLLDISSQDIKLKIDGDHLYCNAPEGKLTPELSLQLREHKTEILEFLHNNTHFVSSSTYSPIVTVPRDTNLPLSFSQQRLWFVNQLEPDSTAYNFPFYLRITGALNVAALEQSLNKIVQRHETLRTTFTSVNGDTTQVINPNFTLKLSIVDLQEYPTKEQEAEVSRVAIQETQLLFNLTQGPLLRATLLHLSEQQYVLLLTMHHIVFDGWSIGLFIKEVTAHYKAFCKGKSSPLSDLPIQYVDFAVWQRQWLQGEVLKSQISYWRKQLEDAPRVLDLPTDYPRPAIRTFQGATYSFELSQKLSVALNTLSQQQKSTLFMTLLASFQILLWRYTGSEDIVVGSPIANRNRDEIKELIGFFLNTLVLRTNLAGNPSFEELLNRVREMTLEAYAHEDLPFELLVNELQPQRSLSHTPLFQVGFVVQNAPISAFKLPGLTLKSLKVPNVNGDFDLNLDIAETKDKICCKLHYNANLFEAATIKRMAGHFQTLLKEITANPKRRLSELSLLTESEQHQLLWEWNNTEIEYPQHQCIHELFEAQVERTPSAIALVFEDQQLTYWELNAKANQLAHYLRSLGVKPEVLVGICVERSLDMVIGLLAILKTGGAYVPLDPAYPSERLAFALQDTQLQVLLTQQYLVENLPQHQTNIVCVDTDWESIAQQSSQDLISDSTTDNLAYIIYTSGSTGKPKGVLVNHSNVVRLLAATESWYNFNQSDVFSLFHSICFDFSVWEMWGALLYGGKLVVVPYMVSRSPDDFYKLLLTQQVTVLNQTPSAFRQLIHVEESLEKSHNLSLRKVIFGGEALQIESLRPWFERHGDQFPQLVNMYGITETTVHVTYRPLIKADLEVASESLIGRPIPDLQVYLLDSHGQPVPIGVPGEMYIGGAGVVRGYLNRPTLTSQRFIPNRFSNKPNARLYKSGDLARYLPNGDIEYLGRIDHQVKVRGFRIELGEIETVISQYPAVREVVVLVREDSAVDSQRIVAYAVAHLEQTLTITELRSFLESKLPNYMVPAVFVTLETLPLTPNGKIDRKSLKAPDTAISEDKELVAPRNFVETKLTEIWAEVLNLKKVGIFENFFELGGDSILAIVIITRAKKAGLQLTVKQLFQHQTVADLASVAVTKKVNQAEQGLITGLTSLTPIQHWFFEQNLLEPRHWNQGVLLEVKQVLDLAVLEKSIQQLLLHHDALRLRFEQIKSGWQQVMASPDVETPFTHLNFCRLSESEQKLAIEETATKLQASLNFSAGPLMRVALFDLRHQPSRLLILIHHLAVDGVSWRILLEDLETLYEQLSQGKKAQLPAKTTSFKYWSRCLQEYAQSAILQQEWDYWLRESWQQIAPLPVDFSDGDNTVASGRNISISLTVEQTQALLKEVPKAYNTQINDVLLTALVQAFSQWTGNNSLLLALEGHGREEIFDDVDLSRTVGWFTSIFPVLLDLGKVSHPLEALKSLKEQLRSIPSKGMGYGVLRYLSQDIAKVELLRSLPQPEVVFNYLGQFDQTFSNSSIFKTSQDSQGQTRSLWNRETYMLSINALIIDNQLKVNWTYSQKIHRQSTIEQLAQGFIEALQILVTHCQSPETGEYTPSDFPEADLSQEQLERFLRKIK